MLTEKDIIDTLDNCYRLGVYNFFIQLGHPYSYLIDCRLNIFRGNNDRWAIAGERLGYNPRAGTIVLEVIYFGNCLQNLEKTNDHESNTSYIHPLDWDQFHKTVDGEHLHPRAEYWIVRGEKVPLISKIEDYVLADIPLREYAPDQVSIEAAGRLLITKHRELFRATDEELYKSLPADLDKIFVLDEWHHEDFVEMPYAPTSDATLRKIYQTTKDLSPGQLKMDFESFVSSFRESEERSETNSQQQWNDSRPGAYETWQQIAKVIVTGDTSLYKPTLEANTHWKNWPESGSL